MEARPQYDADSIEQWPWLGPPLQAGGAQALRCWRGKGPLSVLPQTLTLAYRADGAPDFGFDTVRSEEPWQMPYSLLRFRLQARYPDQAGLGALRRIAARTPLRNLPLQPGFLRLRSLDSQYRLPSALQAPQPLVWNDLDRAAVSMRLDGEAARLMETLLWQPTIPLEAYAEIEYAGIVPGVPLQVEFDPAQLCEALRAESVEGLLGRDELLQRLCHRLDGLPLIWSDRIERFPAPLVAEALLCRLRQHLARFAAAPRCDGESYLNLPRARRGWLRWDLSAPAEGRRALCMAMRPFAALEQRATPPGLRRIVVPKARPAAWKMEISANLPADLEAQFAVVLEAPANPPYRDVAISTPLLALEGPDYRAVASLPFNPGETPQFRTVCYCRLPGGTWQRRDLDAPGQTDPAGLALQLEDFPLRVAAISLSPRLAGQALVKCMAQGVADDAPFRLSATLDATRPTVTLCWPEGADPGAMYIEAVPLDRARPRAVLQMPVQSLELDAAHFPGFGPQSTAIRCEFPDAHRDALLLEFSDADGERFESISLTPNQDQASFTWWSSAPFPCFFRWRRHGEQGWSAPLPASQPLRLVLDAATASVSQFKPEYAQ